VLDSTWTRDALIARTDAAFALDHARLPVTAERAGLRLEYFGLVAAVTRGELGAEHATARFEAITARVSAGRA
jgi:hypothetical protein